MAMQRTIVSTAAAPAAVGPYSQAVRIGDLVYTAGQIPLDPATASMVAGGIEEQTRQVLKNMSAVLEAAGSGMDRIVKMTVFMTDLGHFAQMNAVYRRVLPRRSPGPLRGRGCRLAAGRRYRDGSGWGVLSLGAEKGEGKAWPKASSTGFSLVSSTRTILPGRCRLVAYGVFIQVFISIFVVMAGCGRSVEPETVAGDETKIILDARLFDVHRVAHAGGGVDGQTYTNSYEALNTNIESGFQYFELDFSFTKDGEIVCLHDWQRSFTRTFGLEASGKLTLEEFEVLVKDKSEFTKCTLEGLALWLDDHPNAVIVTDAKEENVRALRKIKETIKEAETRVIPQVYDPENYSVVKQMGFDQIIWTLYRYQGGDDQVLDWVRQFEGPFAVTMPKKRAESSLPKRLKAIGVPSYVHTINSPELMNNFKSQYGISEIYTDFISP